jgi:hypothetical protein
MSTCSVNPNPIFYPAAKLIYSISQSNPAVITTTNSTEVVGGVLISTPANHGYSSGLIVRIDIPPACGMQQLTGYAGEIIVTGLTTFTIDTNTTTYDSFVIPLIPNPAWAETCAQVIPFAENSFQLKNATINLLP